MRLYSDGGLQFTSRTISEFLKTWGVEHIKSSPHFHQSNGLAEAAVKQMKKLLRGSCRNNTIDWDSMARGMLIYCNTPRYNGASPAQRLFGHPIRDLLPAHRRAFDRSWQERADELEKIALTNERVRDHFNAASKDLPVLRVGDKVAIQDPNSKRWERCGTVVERGRHRDYLVKLASGHLLRRNRRHIRKRLPTLVGPGDPSPQPVPADPAPGPSKSAPGRTRYGRLSVKPHIISVDPRLKCYV